MSPGKLAALSGRWREQAVTYDADGLASAATILRRVAGELEAAVREDAAELLTLEQAADTLGCSYSTVQRAVARGEIPNVGAKHRPRVRRGDLDDHTDGPDLVGAVLRQTPDDLMYSS